MKRPKPSTSSYYKEHYHHFIDRIIKEKEQRIMHQHRIEPKRDMGEDDADFIPKGK